VVSVLLVGLAVSGRGLAKDETNAQTQTFTPEFCVRGWSDENGLTAGDIYSLARTRDGFLWLATDVGLTCFDGVRFRTLDTNQFPVPNGDRVTCLLVDRQGVLWAGTVYGHLLRREAKQFQEDQLGSLTDGARLISLSEGSDGSLWVTTSRNGIFFHAQGRWQKLDVGNSLANGGADQVIANNNDQIWVLSGRQLMLYDPKQRRFSKFDVPSSQPVGRIAEGRDGCLWVATSAFPIRGARIYCFKSGQWAEPFAPYPWLQDSILAVPSGLMEDKTGRVWVSTVGSGVFYHYVGGSWQSPSHIGPLVDDKVNTWLQDQEGTIWFGLQGGQLFQARLRIITSLRPEAPFAQNIFQTACIRQDGTIWGGTYGGGVFCHRDGKWIHYGAEQGLEDQYASSIFEDHQSNLWVGTRGGLFQWDGNRFNRIPIPPRADAFVLALFEDKSGALWLSTHQGLVRRQGGRISQFGKNDGLESGPDMRAITEDSDGNIWATVMNRGIFRQSRARFENVTPKQMPSGMDYRVLHFDADGALWVATYGQGLYQITTDKKVRHWSVQDGLPSDYLVALVEDAKGMLWLGSNNGIVGISRQELNQYVPGRSLPLLGRQLSVAEGLDSQICSGWGQPVAVGGGDGRLCFPNQRALAVFDPTAVKPSPLTLPVTMEEVRVDGTIQLLDADSSLRVRSGMHRIEFEYTLPDLLVPWRVHFRYRLQGLEDDWTTTQQRAVDYNHLLPGHYEFQVMASGPDGIWRKSASPVKLEVVPRLWERTSVRISAAALLVGSVGLVVWLVSRARMQRRLLRLEAQQAAESERRRIARDLHDELGSGLTEIMQLGDLGCEEGMGVDDIRNNAKGIAHRTRRLATALDEIVWTTNPRNDSLPKFTGYLCDYAQEFMRATPVRCRLDVVSFPENIQLEAAVRHNLLLACKEALRNVARHSGAKEVWLRIRFHAGTLQIVVEDDGHGFNPDSLSSRGNGLRNMRERIEAFGGKINLSTASGKGSKLTFELVLAANR
jgi:signal transduction histidine kinase/ligand-binding sensor domain-containing protein